jgi:4-hydroxy-3-methylbut-2-enyl diphosphate reductase
MKLLIAKTAGFCFGVDRAIKKVYDSLEEESPLYTYGQIIHNNQVVGELDSKGVKVIESLEQLDNIKTGTIIIRSHGTGKKDVQIMKQKGFNVIDATCPYVKRIHNIVEDYSSKGYKIIIVGNPNHPEVIGIKGWSSTESYIIENVDNIEKIKFNSNYKYCLVAQTTYNYIKYKEIVYKLQNYGIHVIINETICSATEERQKEAKEIASIVDKMIVIGGSHSSNTQKLYQICKNKCENTYHIETIEDLKLNVFKPDDIVGLTAGASTPKNIIEEVILNVRSAKRTEF